jgi:hypothetical protein
MNIALRQSGDDTVRVDERFLLKKEGGRGYSADSVVRHVAGDSSILKSMYSFEDSKGNPRSSSERAQLASLSFGTSFPVLLRELLAGIEGARYQLADSNVALNGVKCYRFAYQTAQKDGSFWIDNGSLALVRLEVRQESNYWVGSYEYHALIDFARPAGPPLLPVRTSAQFGYRRLFTRGTGTVAVVFDSVGADSTKFARSSTSASGSTSANGSTSDSVSAKSH